MMRTALSAAIVALAVCTTVFTGLRLHAQLQAETAPASTRFIVVSQQYVDSGAKVIVLRDTRQPDRKCYLIYEAGAGMLLDDETPCR